MTKVYDFTARKTRPAHISGRLPEPETEQRLAMLEAGQRQILAQQARTQALLETLLDMRAVLAPSKRRARG